VTDGHKAIRVDIDKSIKSPYKEIEKSAGAGAFGVTMDMTEYDKKQVSIIADALRKNGFSAKIATETGRPYLKVCCRGARGKDVASCNDKIDGFAVQFGQYVCQVYRF
jgi:hypothetical protein